MRRIGILVLVVLAAACGHDAAPLGHLVLPPGYQLGPIVPGEPAAFRRQYRADAGATEVVLHRVDVPGGGPGVVIVAMAWRHPMGDDLPALARALAHDVPTGGSVASSVDGRPAQVHRADATFQSTVLAVDGRRGVLVYGSTERHERRLASAVLRGW